MITSPPVEQLPHWMAGKEDEHLEFKEAKNNFHFEKLVDYCVALANEGGGRREGKARCVGRTNAARWFPAPSSSRPVLPTTER